MITAVFDLDGTLVDSIEDMRRALNEAAIAHQMPTIERETVMAWVGGGVDDLVARACADTSVDLVAFRGAYRQAYHTLGHTQTTLYPGVYAGLSRLQAASVSLAVLTNKPADSAVTVLKQMGIYDGFRLVAGPDTFGVHKPDPLGLCQLMTQLGATPMATVMIGDAATDVQVGQAAHTHTVAVTYGYRSVAELEAAKPTYLCHTFSEVVDRILEGVGG